MLGVESFWAMDTGQQIFKDNVKTLSVTNPDNFMSPPVIRMGSSDRLNINFDIISNDYDYLRYRLIHCDANWQPSRLLESEYLDGFNEVAVEDYAFSSNTYIHYVNYNISLPDPELPILASGNYLLQVFPENDADDVWLQARFSVSEDRVKGVGDVTTRTDRGVNSEYQQLFFDLDLSSLPNINPYQDLKVTVTRNNNPWSGRILGPPIRIDGRKATFEHDPALIYEAGNEFRRFETVRTDYAGMHVDSVKFMDGIWHAWLQRDTSRDSKAYRYDSTQHGRFKIDEYNSTDADLSADYVMVHFTFEPSSYIKGKIYLDGEFTSHQLDNQWLMKYDIADGLYHADIPLKQGSYNYQYVVVPEGAGLPSPAPIEGNRYETRNEYLIQVFMCQPGQRADRLVGTLLL